MQIDSRMHDLYFESTDYAHHFSPLSLTKPYAAKSDGCSPCCTPLQICDVNPKQPFLGVKNKDE